MFGGLGMDAINLSKFFRTIVVTEIDPKVFQCLQKNLQNLTIIPDSESEKSERSERCETTEKSEKRTTERSEMKSERRTTERRTTERSERSEKRTTERSERNERRTTETSEKTESKKREASDVSEIEAFNEDAIVKLRERGFINRIDLIYFDPPWGNSFKTGEPFNFEAITLTTYLNGRPVEQNIIALLDSLFNYVDKIIIKSPILSDSFERWALKRNATILQICEFPTHKLKYIFISGRDTSLIDHK
jgi:16S rRNA G966 N2-methylase RsmD